MVDIIYSDPHILVCVKPVGTASQGTTPGALPELIKAQENLNYLAVLHRLDTAVGGVMVFGKSDKAAAQLSKDIADHKKFRKEYLAVVNGLPAESEGQMEDLLFKDSSRNKSFVVKRMRRGVKRALLEYKTLGQKDGKSLVLVRLHTGRTHQIRVQFSSRGMPIVGDGKYGGGDNRCNIALWSYRLGFCHPITGEKLEFSRLPENKYPWSDFLINNIPPES